MERVHPWLLYINTYHRLNCCPTEMCHILAARLLDPDAWKLRIPSKKDWIGRKKCCLQEMLVVVILSLPDGVRDVVSGRETSFYVRLLTALKIIRHEAFIENLSLKL